MAIIDKIVKVREYDTIVGHNDPTSFSWSTQRIGTGGDEGLASGLTTVAAVPGLLNDADVYVRTDTTGFPTSIQARMVTCWTDALHTAYEAHLRA